MDLSVFQDIPGLLTPAEQGNVKQNALMSAAAALMQSAGYSRVPVNAFQALGNGLAGGLAGYKGAMDDALKTETMREAIADKQLQRYQLLNQIKAWGGQLPPGLLSSLGMAQGATPQGVTMPPQGAPQGAGPGPGPAAPPAGLVSSAPLPPPPGAGGVGSTPPAGPNLGAGPTPAPAAAAAAGPSLGAAAGNGAVQLPPGMPPQMANLMRTLPPDLQRAVLFEGQSGNTAAATKLLNDYAGKAALPTDTMKDRAAGIGTPADAANVEYAKGIAGAKAADIKDVITAGGRAARQRLNTLDVMADAIDHANGNISTGPGAENWLKVKQFANNLFPGLDIKGLPETEILTKMNGYLASEAAKQMTSRPSQLEFQAFMKNNPGILNSIQGSKYLINILRQTTQQDIGLRRKAMTQSNLANWGDVEDQFYKDNPIKSPFTGKPLAGDEKVTVPGASPQGATAAPTMTATGPGGKRVGLVNGQWVPLQ